MRKAEAMRRWAALEPGADPLPLMNAIPYKSEGSRYGACGIRVDGTPAFIDAVLSNLKQILAGENGATRLELSRAEVKPTTINGETRQFHNAENGAEVCYVRIHERGREARMMAAVFGADTVTT